MPYKNPEDRNYKKEYILQRKRGEQPKRTARQLARDRLDAKGVDREGKDIDHIKPLSKGGSKELSNTRLVSPSKNRSFPRNADHSMIKNVPKKGK